MNRPPREEAYKNWTFAASSLCEAGALHHLNYAGTGLRVNIGHPAFKEVEMPKFIVERNIPGADKLTAVDLCDISAKSNAVVDGLGVPYVWHHTYAAGDKLYCVHEADSADDIYRHAKEGGFPADLVSEIKNTFGPETANQTA